MHDVSAWQAALPTASLGEVLGSTGAFLAAIGFGGFVGAWIGARKDLEQQRRAIDEQKRARMLAAADEFIVAASTALAALRALDPTERRQALGRWERLVLGDVRTGPRHTADGMTPTALERVKGPLDTAERQLTRLTLHFGPNSDAATAATDTLTKLRNGWETLEWYFALSQASQSRDVARRRALVERAMQTLGEAGLRRVASRVPNLESYLGNLLAQLFAGALLDVERPLSAARDSAAADMDLASARLEAFATDVAVALAKPSPRHGYTVRYVVGTDERVRPVLVPKQRRLGVFP